MVDLLTALEARAISYLITPEDYSIYTHIEIRIIDSIQHGGTSIVYAGKFTNNVVDALRALGYQVTQLQYQGQEKMLRISWDTVLCPMKVKC